MSKDTKNEETSGAATIQGAIATKALDGELISVGTEADRQHNVMLRKFGEITEATGMGTGVAISNFPKDPTQRLELVSKATNGELSDLRDMAGQQIDLEYFFVHTVQLVDDRTGEIEVAPRCVLIDRKGNGYQCVSTGVARSLEQFVQTLGSDVVPPGIVAQVTEKTTRAKRRTLLIQWVARAKK